MRLSRREWKRVVQFAIVRGMTIGIVEGCERIASIDLVIVVIVFSDLPVAYHDAALGVARNVWFVGDDHNRLAQVAVESLEFSQDFDRGFAIEVTSWFISKQQLRIIHQSPGDGYSLLLTTRELIGHVATAWSQANKFELGLSFASSFGGSHTCIEEGQFDVFESSIAFEEVEALEDKPELFIAKLGELISRELANVLTAEPIETSRGAIEAAENVHQGRFA